MTTRPPVALREIRRGEGADELVLVGSDGRSVLLRGDGLTPDERIRMREAALRLIRDALPLDPVPAGPR